MLLTEKAAASVAATAVVSTSTAATDPMTNALEPQLQKVERGEEEQEQQVRQEGQGQERQQFEAFVDNHRKC